MACLCAHRMSALPTMLAHLPLLSTNLLRRLVCALLLLSALRVICGAAFAWQACRTVFNRHPPPILSLRAISSLRKMLRVTRPLSVVYRLLTAPLRTLPDLYILGEVRSGTTTTASLLRSRLRLHGPFTPWVHPLAEDKAPAPSRTQPLPHTLPHPSPHLYPTPTPPPTPFAYPTHNPPPNPPLTRP